MVSRLQISMLLCLISTASFELATSAELTPAQLNRKIIQHKFSPLFGLTSQTPSHGSSAVAQDGGSPLTEAVAPSSELPPQGGAAAGVGTDQAFTTIAMGAVEQTLSHDAVEQTHRPGVEQILGPDPGV